MESLKTSPGTLTNRIDELERAYADFVAVNSYPQSVRAYTADLLASVLSFAMEEGGAGPSQMALNQLGLAVRKVCDAVRLDQHGPIEMELHEEKEAYGNKLEFLIREIRSILDQIYYLRLDFEVDRELPSMLDVLRRVLEFLKGPRYRLPRDC